MYDRKGRYLFAAPEKIPVLASALVRAVGKGHDNELFVLLADLLELEDHLGPLLRAVKVARARHHRVLLVCPWPPGVPLPSLTRVTLPWEGEGRVRGEEKDAADRMGRRAESLDVRGPLRRILARTTTSRFHRAYHQLRRTFARLGVPVLCAQEGEPARLILERIDQLRLLEKKR